MYISKNNIKKLTLILLLSTGIIIIYQMFSASGTKDLLRNNPIKEEYIKNDTLKKASLNFLLNNIEDKHYFEFYFIKKNDDNILKEDFLFQSINSSILMSEKRLRQKIFTEKQFLHYILPYKIRNEKIEDWKKIAINEFGNYYCEDIFEHVKSINSEITKKFKFTGGARPNRRLSEMLKDCQGGCFTMSDLAAFTMRANGIPISIDFTTWSNVKGRHQWNSLITKDGNYPFLGAESNPQYGNNKITHITAGFKKFAKVYRKTFVKGEFYSSSFNPKNLISATNYIDVTKEYCEDCKNITITPLESDVENSIFYLCVYTVDEWVPVDFAIASDGSIKFSNICPNNIFVLKKKVGNKLKYYKQPFTFDKSGEISFLTSNYENKSNVNFKYSNSPDREAFKLYFSTKISRKEIFQNNPTAIIKKGDTYKLYLWKNKWKKISEKIARDSILIFDDIPINALYKLVGSSDTKSDQNRCFTYDGQKQNWW